MKKTHVTMRYFKKIKKGLERRLKMAEGEATFQRLEKEAVAAQVDKLVPALAKVQAQRMYTPSGRIFRILTDLDENACHSMFLHGNDNELIAFMAQRVGRQVERELKTINFSRPA